MFSPDKWFTNPSTGFYPHTLDESLRCNGSNEYLTRTPSSSGNRRTWTFSAWVKPSVDGGRFPLIEAYSGGTNFTMVTIHTDGRIQFYTITSGTDYGGLSTQKLRDPSAWYHIVFRFDTTQSTAADRIRLYVNGTQQESNPWTSSGQVPQNYDSFINHTVANNILKNTNSSQYGQGYIAEVHHADGTSYGPDTFGETKDGVWVPKEVTGVSYGTNGFYLNFADSSDIGNNANSTDGTNDFTVNNFTASDVVSDSPTSNWATLNPLDSYSGAHTFSEGNLRCTHNSGTWRNARTGMRITSGQWYWETVYTSVSGAGGFAYGVGNELLDTSANPFTNYAVIYNGISSGNIYQDGSSVYTGTSYTAGDVMGLALDVDAATVKFYKNGSLVHTVSSLTGTEFYPIVTASATGATHSVINLGQDDSFAGNKTSGSAVASDANGLGTFYYSPPAGLALCTSNLPDPTIGPGQDEQADDYFNTVLYTGDGNDPHAITNVGHQPDWVWIKGRDVAYQHSLYDSVRGTYPNGGRLGSDGNYVENIASTNLKSFDSDGFTLSTKINSNENTKTYVAWSWRAGGSSNTFNIDGTGYASASDAGLTGGNIAADAASISKTAGISILKYTGDGSSSPYSTIKHGLDSPPELYICKSLDTGNADNWVFFHTLVDGTHDFMYLNLTNSNSNSAINFPPTSTTVKVGGNATNENNKNFLMIAIHSVEGYSKASSYVGGGSNFPFIFTGFRPAWLLIKETGNANSWEIYDTKRDPDNVASQRLFPNDHQVEATTNPSLDILSNGFKPRAANTGINRSGGTYLYLAFAEAPFKFANAR